MRDISYAVREVKPDPRSPNSFSMDFWKPLCHKVFVTETIKAPELASQQIHLHALANLQGLIWFYTKKQLAGY